MKHQKREKKKCLCELKKYAHIPKCTNINDELCSNVIPLITIRAFTWLFHTPHFISAQFTLSYKFIFKREFEKNNNNNVIRPIIITSNEPMNRFMAFNCLRIVSMDKEIFIYFCSNIDFRLDLQIQFLSCIKCVCVCHWIINHWMSSGLSSFTVLSFKILHVSLRLIFIFFWFNFCCCF